ncbi:D-arabinono-1,4-lactone oxidase [Pararhodonellum marinum]|uniref:D-arabinono-1,4-lactone oxidase n=1 Tax=Pararhodonellum marinum TaxID=2755358 RepID=UPI00188F7C32|nr:D-arabinono-1,4-lactone oxidase [Pararhodonellum marinum]
MERNTFLKLFSLLLASPIFVQAKDLIKMEKLSNWAGNLVYGTDKVSYPEQLAEIQKIIRKQPKLKALGTRHCFNTIADSQHFLLAMQNRDKVLNLDKQAKTVRVEGGIKYGTLAPYLEERGFALANLASLPHISVVGGCITATHGSGMENGNLATAVSELEMVTADGELVRLSRSKDEAFYGAVVSLGALGVVTEITLDLKPSFQVKQFVFEHLPFEQLYPNFDAIMGAAYSVSLFTDLQSDQVNEVWIKTLAKGGKDFAGMSAFFGGKAATRNLHPIADLSAENCSEQMGVPGPWFDRLPHFRMGFTPSSGKELQSEYFVPHHHAVEAIRAVKKLSAKIGPHLFISEIRSIKGDELWMSPCYRQDSIAIHFTWKQEVEAVQGLLPMIEKELEPFGVRPHWGKLFTISPEKLKASYPKWEDFKNLVATYDPSGKFRNDFLEKYLFGS